MKYLFPIVTLLLVLVGRSHAEEHGATASEKFNDQISSTKKVFERWDKDASPGCAIGVVKDGKLVYTDGFGMANLEYDEPITSKTVFRIASTSKQFTAACIVLLEEEGKLSLDDDIRKYLPELPEYKQTVTLRHMLNHTSGLPEYLTLLEESGDFDDQLDFFGDDRSIEVMAEGPGLTFPVGEKYEYCNSNFFLLSVVVKRVSGMTLAEYAEKNLFAPLGMKNTHFHDDVTAIVKNRATGYGRRQNGEWFINETTLEIVGDGGLFTTIEDMFLWDQNFYRNRLGKGGASLIDKMQTSGKRNNGKSVDYGLGLTVGTYRGLSRIGHGGSWVGFRTHYARFTDQNFSVIVFCNLAQMNPGRLAGQVADIWIGEAMTEQAETDSR
jgi:CubicO group peptidase (beta-lactamase class C family)